MPNYIHTPTGHHEWRCRTCRLLLGVAGPEALQLKYKEVEYRIRGACEHVCRRCRTANSITVAAGVR